MDVLNLVLEVTRQCNMKCAHCLRGEPRNVTMDFIVAKKALDKLQYIDTITFTGGEPFLNETLICRVIDYIIRNNKDVYNFYVATNGTQMSMKTLEHFLRFYAYTLEKHGPNVPDEEIYSQIELSNDIFHDNPNNDTLSLLKGLKFFSQRKTLNPDYIIQEGRGKAFASHGKTLPYNEPFDFDDMHTLYVTAEGNIFPDCDFSYDTMDKLPQVSILSRKQLKTLCLDYNRQIKEKSTA